MDSWLFRIKFSGLTAFVMRPEGSTPGARVFMVNALNTSNKKHRPELRFDVRDKQPSPWKIPCPELEPYYSKRIWSLVALDLDFLPAPGSTLKQPFELDPSINTYLLRLTDLMSGDAGLIDPDCFKPVPQQAPVAVRVPLRHGKLTTTALAFEPSREWVECGFGPKGHSSVTIQRKQFCAIEVTLEIAVEGGPLTLVGVPFSSTSSSSGIAFAPPTGKREVVVELENRPVDPEATSVTNDGREVDDDFSLHYNLSKHKPIDDDRVVPIYEKPYGAFSPSTPPIFVESGNCIVGRFADDAGA